MNLGDIVVINPEKGSMYWYEGEIVSIGSGLAVAKYYNNDSIKEMFAFKVLEWEGNPQVLKLKRG